MTETQRQDYLGSAGILKQMGAQALRKGRRPWRDRKGAGLRDPIHHVNHYYVLDTVRSQGRDISEGTHFQPLQVS